MLWSGIMLVPLLALCLGSEVVVENNSPELAAKFDDLTCTVTVGGNTFDLSSLQSGKKVQDSSGNNYEVNPCAAQTPPSGKECGSNSCAGYQVDGADKCWCLGKTETQSVAATDDGFKVSFNQGSTRTGPAGTNQFGLSFKCGTTDVITFDSENSYNYQFKWTSPTACAGGGGGDGGSGPSKGLNGVAVFDIVVFVSLASFIMFGSAYRWKVGGETGTDVIPLRDFWKDLPFLCKDGVMYTVGVIKTTYYRLTGKAESI